MLESPLSLGRAVLKWIQRERPQGKEEEDLVFFHFLKLVPEFGPQLQMVRWACTDEGTHQLTSGALRGGRLAADVSHWLVANSLPVSCIPAYIIPFSHLPLVGR